MTVVIGRALAEDGLGGPTVLSIRFGVASVVLLVGLALVGRSVLPAPGERVRVFLLGAVGYGAESSLFFLGLERGTAAAVTLLFYAYPAMVVLAELGLGIARPTARLLGGLALSTGGVAVVVVSGGDVDISPAGIACALGAAACFTAYLLASDRLVERTPPAVSAAWVAGGAATSMLVRGLVTSQLRSPAGHWPELVGNGFATAAAFGLMFAALQRIGATRTAVIMTFEAFAAAGLAAVVLDESLGAAQLLGGVAIVGGAVLVTLASPQPDPVPEL